MNPSNIATTTIKNPTRIYQDKVKENRVGIRASCTYAMQCNKEPRCSISCLERTLICPRLKSTTMMIVTMTICPMMIPAFANDPKMFCDTVEVGVSLYTV